jgi:nitrate reductase gamma subunit
MYEFSRGPLVWIAFGILLVGGVYRVVSVAKLAKKDKVVWPYMRWKFGLRSIIHWLIPYGSANMRMRPVFTLVSFLFHICLLLTPILTAAHVFLWKESWKISWWTLPDTLSKVMVIIVLGGGLVFVLRRIANPTVRFVTSAADYVLVVLVLAPFATGLMAYYQMFDYQTIVIIHMWTGAIWLAMIPFTRIAHMLFFPLTRAYMGSEFGFVRNAKDW